MTLTKAQVVEVLRSRGDHAAADRLHEQLPDLFDPSDYEAVFDALDLDAVDAARHADPAPGGVEDPAGPPSTDPRARRLTG